jgi:acyl phosphate:glycerol-3-phosphate acyltransferase
MTITDFVLPAIVAYLIGSIPTAVWIGKMFYKTDVRKHGSGNAGATNTIRVLGLRAGIPVLLFDVFKGYAAVWLTPLLVSADLEYSALAYILLVVAAAVVLGHTFPLYASFKGGKGVATLLGVGFGLYPLASLVALAIFIVVLAVSRYVSLSSITAAVFFPLIVVFIFPPPNFLYYILAIAVAVFLPLTHRKNIKRLLEGSESKLSFSKKAAE